MLHTFPIVVPAIAVVLAGALPAQLFEQRSRGPTPALQALLASNGGIPLDIDGVADIDIVLKGGSALLSDGNLGFTWSLPGTRIPTVGSLPNYIDCAGDVTGDGVPDLVAMLTSLTLTTDVFVNVGQAGGSWAPRVVSGSTPGLVTATRLRDIDGDAFPDLLCHRYYPTSGNSLLRNQGDGTFVDVTATALPAIPMDAPLALGDVDGDGDPDLVVRSSGTVMVLQNIGSGVFAPAGGGLPAVAALQSLQLADADADGDLDLLIATAVGAPLELWLGAGDGTFTVAAAGAPNAGTGHAFADLDGDQRADLLVIAGTANGQQLLAHRNLGGGQFQAVSSALVDTTVDLGEPVLADLEGDGDLDAIVGGCACYLHDGQLGFAALQRQPIAETAIDDTVAAGDFDGDEAVDLVVGDVVHRNRGDGTFTRVVVPLPSGARGRAFVDVDNDGDLDLVWSRAGGLQDGGVLDNQNGVLVPGPLVTGGALVGRVFVADFDADGLPDLVSDAGRVLRNVGGLAFPVAATLALLERPVAVGDFDGDGQIDLVTANASTWTLRRNLGNFVFQAVSSVALAVKSAEPGDFDGDGDLDLAVTFVSGSGGSSSCALQVWSNTASGFVGGLVLADGYDLTGTVAAGDFDRDGDLDLVTQTLWFNQGALQFSLGSGLQYGTPVAVADLDGDRDLDIVRAAKATSGEPRRAWVFANRFLDLDAERLPVLGHPHTVTVGARAGLGGGGDLVLAALAATRIAPIAIPSVGLLQVDPLSIAVWQVGVTAASGLAPFTFALPPIAGLAGLEVYWQGAVFAPTGLQLTGLLVDRLLF